jgi:hypothetical protein
MNCNKFKVYEFETSSIYLLLSTILCIKKNTNFIQMDANELFWRGSEFNYLCDRDKANFINPFIDY